MQILKDRIRKDGKIKAGNVLKVDSFLNHQMDIRLFGEIGKEFKRRFADSEVTKILTIEASGIGIAVLSPSILTCRWYLPRKRRPKTLPERCTPPRWNPLPTAECTISSYPRNSWDPMIRCC